MTFLKDVIMTYLNSLCAKTLKFNDFDSIVGSTLSSLKTKTLIVNDIEGFFVVPPGLEPGTN